MTEEEPQNWESWKEGRQFLFDWDLLLRGQLNPDSEFDPICFFSRVYLEDYDLLNKGADDINAITKKLKGCSIEEKKCNKFLTKINQLGFAHTFEISLSGDSSELMENKEQPPNSSGDRDMQSYSDLNLFDVDYEVYKPSFNPRRVDRRPQQQASSNEAVLDGNTSEQSSQMDTINDAPQEDKLNFDFNYDPERDKKLVAKNADDFFKNDKELMKYWFQRFRLFSKLNKGILMDREAWFSVTPERIAEHIADRMVPMPGTVILDAFTGAGGNAIQFATSGAFVYAVDIDPVKIRCAVHNARIYGVLDRITFICGDFFHVAKSLLGSRGTEENSETNLYGIDAIFLSPPWGGPSYLQSRIFDLDLHVTPNGFDIFKTARKISPNICYFLPRQTDVKQLVQLAGPGGRVEIEHSVLNNKVKTLSGYYGNLVSS
ncbi:RNA cap guanine-N2 methyltransferase domain-containing protein [Ditylenchus destructor]|uniref:Trimethylguanosine synthase n=1 Tax=Ditylenchus destructor TaxID=166010 RepID=A0AAD4R055_9BILA|nr:RNA cap guanine-N2 methyltransferase domain-containing protein [Ditylenchus destructor]